MHVFCVWDQQSHPHAKTPSHPLKPFFFQETLPGSATAAVMEGAVGPLTGDALPGGRPITLLRPRLLVCGPKGAGQGHVARAVLHALEVRLRAGHVKIPFV